MLFTMNSGRRLFNVYQKLSSRAQGNRKHVTSRSKKIVSNFDHKLQIPEPEYDLQYLCNPKNRDEIYMNIKHRKGVGDIDKVLKLSENPEAREALLEELEKIPNRTAPGINAYGDAPKVLSECGVEKIFHFPPLSFNKLAKNLQLVRSEHLGPLTGERSYIFVGDLARLEEALIRYSVKKLLDNGFKLVGVPDILPTSIIGKCGLAVDQERTLIYSLEPHYGDDLSLSGTSEMALAGKLVNAEISASDLPVKLAAVSRCYRAEISNLAEERGLYRVHQFTKVEMFGVSNCDDSSNFMNELREIQQNFFADLSIRFKVLDMPAHELGASAYRKFDIEGWLPGQQRYGELSSCSNCTDYQSRRLNIKYKTMNGEFLYAHTLNGTACAVPRALIAICETNQTEDGNILIPEILIPYMNGKTMIEKQPIASMRDFKYKKKI